MTRKRRQKQKGGRKARSQTQWVDFIRKNELFEQFYKIQQIVPEDEFPAFMEAMQKELPSTFRITGTRSHAQELLSAMRKIFLCNLETVQTDEVKGDPPKPLPWYPDELAWQINLTKRFIRKASSMDKFHKFLVHETESGNISRQEAVSMIPPLLLDVKPGQKILDACAAPGSKTVQLVELLHSEESSGIHDGLVIANELQNKRCYMLVHQSKRLHSPCCLITNHDAALFPTMFMRGEGDIKVPLLFDRILCDVPCSGDGTLRKNPQIWRKWTPQLGLGLFRIQLRILARAVEMLAVGGRIVYSTCTMNPVEDEAVICNLLQKAEGAVELVDVSSYLPNLKRSPGLKTWKVITKTMEIVENCDPGTQHYAKGFKPQMLAPPVEIAEKFHLERCMRIYPHQQDTGGFFIAVLQKKCHASWENGKRCSTNPRLLPWETEADWQRKKQEKCENKDTQHTLLEKEESKMDSNDRGKVEDQTRTCETVNSQANTVGVVSEDLDCSDAGNNVGTNIDDVVEHDSENMPVDSDENKEDCDELSMDTQADCQSNHTETNAGAEKESVQDNGSSGDHEEVTHPPRKKMKMEMRGFKEDPFVFLKDDDEHWPPIKKFYGIDDSFPANQLLVRSHGGKKRNVYLVSKAVKDVMELVDENHKVVNTGLKVIARAECDNVDCFFRLMQEGIEALLPFVSKRKVFVTQEDIRILLTQDRPFCTEFSSTTVEQLNKIEGQGCIVYVYDPKGPYSKAEDTIGCRVTFCGWKAKVSTRVQISKFDKAHYQVLCGISPGEILKAGTKTCAGRGDGESAAKPDEDSIEDFVDNQGEDEEQAGYIGDILNMEAPEGSLDVGYI